MFFVIANLRKEIRQAFILTLNMRPKLEYASVISNLCTNDNITVLEKIRLKAVRFFFLLYGPQFFVVSFMEFQQVFSLQSQQKGRHLKILYSLFNRKLKLDSAPFLSLHTSWRTRSIYALFFYSLLCQNKSIWILIFSTNDGQLKWTIDLSTVMCLLLGYFVNSIFFLC